MLAPVTPHLCEEIWEAMGYNSFVSSAKWPEFRVEDLNPEIDEKESAIKLCLEDISSIMKVTGITPRSVYIYTATAWKWKVYMKALELSKAGTLAIGILIRESLKDEELRKRPEAVAAFAREVVEDVTKTPEENAKRRINIGKLDESALFGKTKAFFETELNTRTSVQTEDETGIYDPEGRAKRAKPYKPAIFIEA